MHTPLVGVTTYGRGEKNRFTLPGEYVDAVRRAGGIPLLVPPGDEHIDAILRAVDAVIFTGGGDADPKLYGGNQHETVLKPGLQGCGVGDRGKRHQV